MATRPCGWKLAPVKVCVPVAVIGWKPCAYQDPPSNRIAPI